jgi:hypothetical protein
MRSNGPVAPATVEQKRIPADFENRAVPVEIVEEEPGTGQEDEIMLPESYYDSQESAVLNNRPIATGTAREKPTIRNQQEKTKTQEETGTPVTRDEEKDHRVSIPANEVAEISTIAPAEVKSQVSVKTNSYTIAALGGIRNLELTLTNASEFLLDKVTVEVRFLNPNGNIVKSEDIHFKSIRPNATQTIAMKKSNRGVKVTYRIVRIESKDAGMDTAGL